MNKEALIEKMRVAVADATQMTLNAESSNETSNGCTPEEENSCIDEVVTAVLTAITEAGMVVVPREPTVGMLTAGGSAPQYPNEIYKAMLAAGEKGE